MLFYFVQSGFDYYSSKRLLLASAFFLAFLKLKVWFIEVTSLNIINTSLKVKRIVIPAKTFLRASLKDRNTKVRKPVSTIVATRSPAYTKIFFVKTF